MGMEMASTDRRSLPSIAEFFENRSVFVTGGTGFLGKLLIEKLLRSCSGVKHIYVLVRPKRRQNPEQRLRELVQSQAFDRLRHVNPQALSKIIAIKGNLVEAGLGLSDEDEATLTREVSVVFHSAATVNFEEPLKNAVAMNLHGTLAIIQLCWKLSNLAAFVHLSTAYSNCERSETFERIYPTAQDPEKVLSAASWLSPAVMDEVFQATKGNKPNTYIYTKALAEALVESRATGLPTAIVRPSIVAPTCAEPYPGWIDSPNGPIGLFLASGNGLLRTLFCDKAKRADMVPADYVINVMIAAAWHTALTSKDSGARDMAIYNYASGVDNPLTWGDALTISMAASQEKCPFETAVFYPAMTMTTSPLTHRINSLLFQVIPAVVLDCFARWTGRPARLMKIQRKLLRTQGALAYFCLRDWDFRSKNVPVLSDAMSDVDKKSFNFDIKGLVWKEYLESAILGCRTYFLGQTPASIPECVGKIARMKRCELVAKATSTFFLFWFIARLISIPLRRRPFTDRSAKQAVTMIKKL